MGGRGAASGGGGGITDQDQHAGQEEFSRISREVGDPRDPSKEYPNEEYVAWSTYTGGDHYAINTYHRTGVDYPTMDSEKMQSVTQNLDTYIGRNALDREVTLYRGMGAGAVATRLAQPERVGEIFTDAGYMSTSLTPASAAFFALQNEAPILRIRAPRGTNFGVGTTFEQELILPRNTSLRITGVSRRSFQLSATSMDLDMASQRVIVDAVVE